MRPRIDKQFSRRGL